MYIPKRIFKQYVSGYPTATGGSCQPVCDWRLCGTLRSLHAPAQNLLAVEASTTYRAKDRTLAASSHCDRQITMANIERISPQRLLDGCCPLVMSCRQDGTIIVNGYARGKNAQFEFKPHFRSRYALRIASLTKPGATSDAGRFKTRSLAALSRF